MMLSDVQVAELLAWLERRSGRAQQEVQLTGRDYWQGVVNAMDAVHVKVEELAK